MNAMLDMIAVIFTTRVGMPGRLVVRRMTDMGWYKFTAAVVAAVDHALPNSFKVD